MAVAALVLGILSLVFSCVTPVFLSWLAVILAIIGIVLASVARKNPENRGLATGGLVCSIIGLILGIIVWAACAACVGVTTTIIR